MSFDELKDREFACQFLGGHLNKGQLVLFLGAGVSDAFHLPGWLELVNAMRAESGLSALGPDPKIEDLQVSADECEMKFRGKDAEFRAMVSRCLYKGKESFNATIFESPLLISISALLMGSKRGHVTKVITLNYDSLLEWFLGVFGFHAKSISTLPVLEGSEDVRIYHPHGYLPHLSMKDENSDFLIMSLGSIAKRLADHNDPWYQLMKSIMSSGVCLFIGMSPNSAKDHALSVVFRAVNESYEFSRAIGIWLVKGDLSAAQSVVFQSSNITPLSFADYDEYPQFLFEICQAARAGI